MEAFRRQATKLREQVAKQQQAVLKQLGHLSNEAIMADEDELECHQHLQNLYNSTTAAKHFQKYLVRGVEGFVSTSKKQMQIVRKLAEDCCQYGNEYQSFGPALSNASLLFGTSHKSMEEERENMLEILGQVTEPLRESISGAPLEDARHLTHHYDRIRHEVEAQAAEVAKRQFKSKEAGGSAESALKLQRAEAKLSKLKHSMMAVGREATAAMLSVEEQQQRLTFQQLLIMVDAEKSYHHSVADILEKLQAKMVLEKQQIESESQTSTLTCDAYAQGSASDTNSSVSGDSKPVQREEPCFIAKVVHPFDAQADGELSLSIGDFVVVHQVTPKGWSEGECMGKAGWFPTAYIEKQDKALASKVTEGTSPP